MSISSAKATAVRSRNHRGGAGALVALGLIALVAAACSSGSLADQAVDPPFDSPAPTASPTLEPTSSPTAVPTPSPVPAATAAEIKAACTGKPIAAAAKYEGTVHPLVAVYWGASDGVWILDQSYDVNSKWFAHGWPSPIQLVVCVGVPKEIKISSCGTYIRSSDGAVGPLIRYERAEVVSVVVAATGKTLQSQTFAGNIPKCPASLPMTGVKPPWPVYGTPPDDGAINKYATSVSVQKVK